MALDVGPDPSYISLISNPTTMNRIFNAILGAPGLCVIALALITVPPYLSAMGNARLETDCQAKGGVPTWTETRSINNRPVSPTFSCAR